jgi:hypothetical protein
LTGIQVVEGLSQTCAGDRASFDAAFESVHLGFHYLMDLSMGEEPAKTGTIEDQGQPY